MSNTIVTIDDICEDILCLVFDRYLNLKNQLNCQLVCKRFHRLIQQIFDGKRALYLTDGTDKLLDICDENLDKYWTISVEQLYELRDGFWIRSQRGHRLLQRLEIQMFALRRHKYLNALCLVISGKTNLDQLFDQIIDNCVSNLEKLIILNLNGSQLSITDSQMENLCQKYPQLRHFELFSDYIYATEDSFGTLFRNCQTLEAFKLRVRQIFTTTVTHSTETAGRYNEYNSFKFNGSAFAQTNGLLSAIDVSHPIISNDMIVNCLPKIDSNLFLNVKHLGVERILPNGMQRICLIFKSLVSLSVSMDYDLSETESSDLIKIIGQMSGLQKLSIRWFGKDFDHNMRSIPIDYNTFQGLSHCIHLKHLVIKEAVLTPVSLQAINRCVSGLQVLRIVDCSLDVRTFNPINEFSCLRELIVMRSHPYQTYVKFNNNGRYRHSANEINLKCIELQLIKQPKHVEGVVPLEVLPQDLALHLFEDDIFMPWDSFDCFDRIRL